MFRDGVREAVDALVLLRRHRLHRQLLEGPHQRVREAVQPVPVRNDALALHLVQHLPHLFGEYSR